MFLEYNEILNLKFFFYPAFKIAFGKISLNSDFENQSIIISPINFHKIAEINLFQNIDCK